MNLLTDEKQLAAAGLSQDFGFRLLQSQRMPELILVTVSAYGHGKVPQVELLCLWTGSRTKVLSSKLSRAFSTRGFAFDLNVASVDPLGLAE